MNTRQKLRNLIKEGCDINSNIEREEYAPLLKKITKISKESDAVQSEENNTLILKTGITRITNTSLLNVLETKKNLVFNENELVEALTGLVQDEDQGEDFDWMKITDRVTCCFKTVYLPYPVQISHERRQEPEQKPRSQRVKRSTQMAPATAAEKLSRFEGENARALESVYNDIIRSYVEGGRVPLPFYKLICDPSSFTKSVNNAFQLSFLIQSNLVRVSKTDAGETIIEPIDLNAPFTSQKGGDNCVHAVITLDYDLWEATVNNYHIETSMICS